MNSLKQSNLGIWVSAYIYCSEPFEPILREFIYPAIKYLTARKLINSYFFIRYWERGPHIRLRLKVKNVEDIDFVKSYLDEYATKNSDILSFEKNKDHANKFEECIDYNDYVPEVDRYGGAEGMKLAENHFEASSNTILLIISKSTNWDYASSLGHALQLHVAFIHEVKMNLIEASNFFNIFSNNWVNKILIYKFNCKTKEDYEQKKYFILSTFEKSYQMQKEHLNNTVVQIWSSLEKNVEFEEDWMNYWTHTSRKTSILLDELNNLNLLFKPAHYNPINISDVSSKSLIMWSIYDSYIHMTNNRLGISNEDEGYLGYILSRLLYELE